MMMMMMFTMPSLLRLPSDASLGAIDAI
jgi:hypothetical protein